MKHKKRQEKEKILKRQKQSSEQDLDMTQKLEVSDRELKIIMSNTLKANGQGRQHARPGG